MKKEVDKRLEEIMSDIEKETSPESMSQEEALEFYDELDTRISCNRDCLKEEIENRDEG